ncbi:peptidase S8/S53 domain-containing protein [Geopyxis carbonaria]|nr:peptidase S8/S53 domain-containing protein [Geopyxis carbonaria]
MRSTFTTALLALATSVLAMPHGGPYGSHHGSAPYGGPATGTPSTGTPIISSPEPSTTLIIDPGLNTTDPAHDETPGSGGTWTLIVDNDDPRSLHDLFEEMSLDASTLKHVYNNSAFKGFAGELSSHCVNKLQSRTGLRTFEPEFEVRVADRQINAPWGLQRVSQTGPILNGTDEADANVFSYKYNDTLSDLGKDVDIYIIDTGINTDHVDFDGRATFGFAVDGNKVDTAGHGTHCAGTAAGTTFGMAKGANIIAVKVLDESGTTSDILRGLDYVVARHDERKNSPNFAGSVASMSLGSAESSTAINEAVMAASANGIHFSVAAGNEDQDACNSSPAAAGGSSNVITVGATTIAETRASFSNFGACTTVYAPGEDIPSTWIGGDNTVKALSGTSMACPHVTGLIAYHLARDASLKTDVKAMKDKIIREAFPLDTDKGVVLVVNNGATEPAAEP